MSRASNLAKWPLFLGSATLLAFACGDGESTAIGGAVRGNGQAGAAPEGGARGALESAGSGGVAGAGDGGGAAGEVGSAPVEPNCEAREGNLGDLVLVPVVTDLAEPVYVVSPPGDSRQLFVVQRSGKLWLVENGERLPEPFLELEVQWDYAEKGLLGLAFHPDYANNGLFYVDYVTTMDDAEAEGDLVIAEYQRDPEDPTRALPDARRELLRLPQATAKHKAGTLSFDAEGRLLISVGNMGDSYTSADPGDLYGSVLRIDPNVDGETYAIPDDNPQQDGWAPEVLEYGLRNPWRISLDPCTGDLYMADVGSEEFEEVNLAPSGEHGHDYGFRDLEGDGCHALVPDCDPQGRTMPIGGYPHDDGRCAIIGGFVYRGHAIPALRGSYLYADLCSGRVYALRYEDGEVQDEREITELVNPDGVKGITSFGVDASYELYLLSRNERAVYRIAPK